MPSYAVLVERQYVGSHSGIEKNRLRCMENKCIMVKDKVDLFPVMHQSSKVEKANACIIKCCCMPGVELEWEAQRL